MYLTKNHNNFDLLRLVAASLVLISHTYDVRGISGNEPLLHISAGQYSLSGVGLSIFFTISGFLVSKSLDETPSVKVFLLKRFLRIWPGLIVNILFTIFVTGLFFTVLKFADFLIDPQTIKYLLVNATLVKSNLWLPGTFEGLPVNVSLWTIPVEVRLYILLLIGYLTGVFRRKYIMMIVWIGCILFFIFLCSQFSFIHKIPRPVIWDSSLIMFFLSGSVAYVLRANLKFNLLTWVTLFTFWVIAAKLLPSYRLVFDFPFLTYTILFFGKGIYTFPFLKTDLSYGIYLYGYPVQAGIQYILGNKLNFLQFLLIAIIITVLLAIASWNLVEKRALSKKASLK
jgi:peptidoglycan/LPS O-acetylase OafA/YrhL